MALKRPYTFVVLALLILLVGPLTIARTATDIFPNIDIPVVTVVWNHGGLSADEMSNRIVSIDERNLMFCHRAMRTVLSLLLLLEMAGAKPFAAAVVPRHWTWSCLGAEAGVGPPARVGVERD